MIAATEQRPVTEQFQELRSQFDQLRDQAADQLRELAINTARTGQLPDRELLVSLLNSTGRSLKDFEQFVIRLQQRIKAAASLEEIETLESQRQEAEAESSAAYREHRRIVEETKRQVTDAERAKNAAYNRLRLLETRIDDIRSRAGSILNETGDRRRIDAEIEQMEREIFWIRNHGFVTPQENNSPSEHFLMTEGKRLRQEIEEKFLADNAERFAAAGKSHDGQPDYQLQYRLKEELNKALQAAELQVSALWNERQAARKSELEARIVTLRESINDPLNIAF